jgi:DNA-directed RNA polymerase specialized sigma24 family protein
VASALLLGRFRPAGRVEIDHAGHSLSGRRSTRTDYIRFTKRQAMSLPTSRKKVSGITQESFNRLLAELDPDSERAGEQYEKIRRKLVKMFQWRGCVRPEECADETFNRVAQKICEGTTLWTGDPYSYFHGVALNVLREYWRSPEQRAETLEEMASAPALSADPEELMLRQVGDLEKERLLDCLNGCLQKLPPESFHLITRYHQGEEAPDKVRRKELARALGIPLNALRIRAYRIRVEIEECVGHCLERRPKR